MSQAARAGRHLAFGLCFATIERGLAYYNKNLPVYNYLTAGTGTAALFGFAAGQTRRAVIIGGAVSLVTLPLYLAFIANEDRLVKGIAGVLGVDVDAELAAREAMRAAQVSSSKDENAKNLQDMLEVRPDEEDAQRSQPPVDGEGERR